MRAKKMTPSQNNEAIIFKTEVSIDNKGNLITRHESLPPEPVLKELGNDFYAHDETIRVEGTAAPVAHFNNFERNRKYAWTHLSTMDVDASQNWWGTVDEDSLAEIIYDQHDIYTSGIGNIEPILSDPNP